MSEEYPIIAITGSSGAGSSKVTKAFDHIFRRERVKGVYIQGSAFHRYAREDMLNEQAKAKDEGRVLSHYGPEGNYLDKLESLFFEYAATGAGMHRYYLHTQGVADDWGQELGTLTPWKRMKKNSDLLLYRGLHGAAISNDIDISQYPDLLIGIVPNINLEWIRKINRDTSLRNYSEEQVKQFILDRMHDYASYITPQFSRTHINFQMIPVIDTTDPFTLRKPPTEDECQLVIHFQKGLNPDFPHLLSVLPNSFLSNQNTIVVSGADMFQAIEAILIPKIQQLVERSRELRGIKKLPKKNKCGLIGQLSQSTV